MTVYGRTGSVLEKIAALDPRIKTEKGTLEDCDKLEKLAAEHDITINCANADGIEATKAINRGLKARFDKTGKKPILIHTSGTGTLSDVSTHLCAAAHSPPDVCQFSSIPSYSTLNPIPG